MVRFKGRILKVLLTTTVVLQITNVLITGGTHGVHAEGPADPAPVVNPVGMPNGKKVLFDNTHGQTAGAADWVIDGGFSDFANGLAGRGYSVKELRKTTPITLADLLDYDAFVIGEANIPYKASEQEAMVQYVQGGGSIFFIADHYNADRNKNRWDASEVMNGYRRGAWDNPAKGMTAEEAASSAMQGVQSSDWLSDHFGVRFRYNALADITTGQTIVPPDQSFGITQGVSNVAMHAGSTLAITDPTKAKGLIYLPQTNAKWANAVDQGVYNGGGVAEGPYSAIAKAGAGKAAFIGDSSPVEDETPKYLREETGTSKTTYAGWKEEQDSAYLLNLIDWLTTEEPNITSLDQYPGLELDQPTPLLPFENPPDSTEPQAEPWAAPAAGYKWYDPSTFKSGSYGSAIAVTNPTYSFVSQSPMPSNEQVFPVRVVIDNMAPGATLSNLNVGAYNPSGGAQLGMISLDGGATWPTSPGYSASFAVTANAKGHAVKEVLIKLKGTPASANFRIRQGSNALLTKTVPADATAQPQELPPDIPPVSTIVMARSKASGTTVSIEGIVTTQPGAFGDQSFYLQDSTGGIYVPQNSTGYNVGDKVLVSGDLTLFNGELGLASIHHLAKTGTDAIPVPETVTSLHAYNQGQLVSLDQVVIQNFSDAAPAGSFEFDAVAADSTTSRVRVDARTGLTKDIFLQSYGLGDKVQISGVASVDNSTFQLKPRGLSDFVQILPASPSAGGTGNSSGSGNAPASIVTGLTISTLEGPVYAGDSKQFYANAQLSAGSSMDITPSAVWESSIPAVATVSGTGIVSALNAGTTVITATYEGQSYPYSLQVLPALGTNPNPSPTVTLAGLNATPATFTQAAGYPSGSTVIRAVYHDNSTVVISNQDVIWSSQNANIASASETGMISFNSVGSTVITATYGGQQAFIAVTVLPAEISPTVIVPEESSSVSQDAVTPAPVRTAPVLPAAPPGPGASVNADAPDKAQAGTPIFRNEIIVTEKVVHSIRTKVAESSTEEKSIPADTAGHWAEKTVGIFVKLHIIEGYEDGTAKPDATITRAEFAQIISRVFDVNSSARPVVMNDLSDHWAKNSIEKLAQSGVLSGYGDGTFRPDKAITREEMIVILSRLVNLSVVQKDESKGFFKDLQESYAEVEIKNAAEAGIINGKREDTFDPKSESTRAEALQVILNTLNLNPEVKTLLDTMK
ncbi:S-layer homology domain-containing protein [Paenibacillus silviterrae]|uniref:S-layer homology domain-containing protein n=1 Tax=Paenibacillus silviterrae TaxID=3242194 RepID=UPI0025427705|nr:S-layer homology domain-containing protein [Paenibacillus chinjuensis]